MKDPEKCISNALRLRPSKLPHRATFTQSSPEIFADNRQLDRIDNENWQIVFGRRGSGKTTILASYASYLTNSPENKRLASIEINTHDFKADLSAYLPNLTDRQIAQIYFADFMNAVASHLFKVFDSEDARSKFYRSFLEFAQGKRQQVENLVVAIHNSVTKPEAAAVTAHWEETRKAVQQNEHSRNAGLEVGFKAGASNETAGMGVDASGKIGASESKQNSDTVEINIREEVFKIDYFKTRNYLIELLELLKIDKLFLILDEWSELDRSIATDIQPHFAELLKMVFWNQPQFVVKIGAIRKQTRLSSTSGKGSFGFEVAGDIFEIDLDQVYCSDEISIDRFFEDLLFRHLVYCDERLKDFIDRHETTEFFGTTYFRPISTFIEYIFKRREDFAMLVRGAGGLPRDFLEMLDDVASFKRHSVSERWNSTDIRRVVTNHYVQKKLKNLPETAEIGHLHGQLIERVLRNHSRTVLVPVGGSLALRNAVAQFYHYRLLHDVRSSAIPAPLRRGFDFYNVDLGIVYDARKDMLEGFLEGDGCYLPPDITPEGLNDYILESQAPAPS